MNTITFDTVSKEKTGIKFPKAVEFSKVTGYEFASISELNETAANALSRVALTIRWWAESRGYFNRKLDAFNFLTTLTSALNAGVIQLPTSFVQQVGVTNYYKQTKQMPDWYFVNQETYAPKPNPNIFEFPVYSNNYLVLNSGLPTNLHIELGKVLAILADVSITLSSYPSTQELLSAWTNREYTVTADYNEDFLLALLGTNSSLTNCLALEAVSNNWLGNLPSQLDSVTQNTKFRSSNIIFSWKGNVSTNSETIAKKQNPVLNIESLNVTVPKQIVTQKSVPEKVSRPEVAAAQVKTEQVSYPKQFIKSLTVNNKLTVLSLIIYPNNAEFYCQVHKSEAAFQNNINLVCRLINKLSLAGQDWQEILNEVTEESIFTPELGKEVIKFLQQAYAPK